MGEDDRNVMMDTFMSEKSGYGFNVAIQHPFITNIFSKDTYAPKPVIGPGQYVYISKIKTFGEKQEFVKRLVLAHQCCTHYVMFSKDSTEEPTVMKNMNGCTFWYLIQNPENPLSIDWVKEKDLLRDHENAVKDLDIQMNRPNVDSLKMDTNSNPYSVSI
jgi:hypothetical protein